MVSLLAILLFNLTAGDSAAALAGVFRYQSALAREVHHAAFTARYCYQESDPTGTVGREIVAERAVTMDQFSRQRHEFRWMELNGRRLSRREMQRELIEWRVQEVVIRKTRLPFNPDRPAEYHYSLTDEDSTWIVRFEPAGHGDGYLRGLAWIDRADSSVRRLEFVPVGLPFILENMWLTIDYGDVEGYRLPLRFRLTMDIRVKALVTLFWRHVEIEEDYSDYRLNSLIEE